MADRHPLNSVLRHVRALTADAHADGLPDHELLGRFASHRDEAAFEAILARYGPLVWGVCHRAVANCHDAEDAFQATFLTLARQAASVRRADVLGSWLYGVASRVASKLKEQGARRRAREERLVPPTPADPLAQVTAREACGVLDEEVARLPERLRAPLVLCYLESKARDEAAHLLGWSLGTLKRRLERARAVLRARLAHRGLALSAGLLGLALSEGKAAAIPAALRASLAGAAAAFAAGEPHPAALSSTAVALAEGVLRATIPARVTALAVALALVACASLALCIRPAPGEPPAAPVGPGDPEQTLKDTSADRYGDPLPVDALARLGTVRFRDDSFVSVVAVSPDGTTLASAGHGALVHLWDAGTGRKLRELHGHERFIASLAFSPDSKRLATASADKTVRLWDVATGKERLRLEGHEREVTSTAFSPDGAHVVSGSRDATVRLWDAHTGQAAWQNRGHKGAVSSVTFSPDGKSVASGGADRAIVLRETTTGKEQRRFEGHGSGVASVAFSPDGKALVSGSRNETSPLGSSIILGQPDAGFADKHGSLRIWDVATGKALRTLPGPKDGVTQIAAAPDGKAVAVAGADNTVRLYDWGTGGELWRAGGELPWVRHLAFAEESKMLITCGDAALRCWDVATGKEVRQSAAHTRCVSALAFAPNGKTVATGGWDHTIRLWDPATGKERFALEGHAGGVMSLAFSPNGATLASASEDRTLRLWDAVAGKELRCFEGHGDFVQGVAFSADGKGLVSASTDQTVRVWDVAGGRQLLRHAITGQTRLSSVAVAPDGKRVAVGCLEGMPADQFIVRVFETKAGKEVLKLNAGTFEVPALAFSADGGLLASGGRNGTVVVWDGATGEPMHRLKHDGEVLALVFAADGRVLASGGAGGEVRLWEVSTGKERLRFAGASGCYSLAFAPGGGRLVSGHFDSAALVWDVAGVARPGPYAAGRLEALWRDLEGEDAVAAYQAVRALAASPGQAVPLLRGRLRVASDDALAEIAGLIRDLDSDNFATREKATRRLEALGHAAAPKVRQAREAMPGAEVRRRAEGVLAKLAARPIDAETVCALRAIEVLERVGTAEARQALALLAERAICPRTGEQARAALQRLGGQ